MKGLLTRIYNRHPHDARGAAQTEDQKQWQAQQAAFGTALAQINDLLGWRVPSAPLLQKAHGVIVERADGGKIQEAIGLLKGLAGKVATKHAAAKVWFADGPRQGQTFKEYAELKEWGDPSIAPLAAEEQAWLAARDKEDYAGATAGFNAFVVHVDQIREKYRQERAAFGRESGPVYYAAHVATFRFPPNTHPDTDKLGQQMWLAQSQLESLRMGKKWNDARAYVPKYSRTIDALIEAGERNAQAIETALKKRAIISPKRLELAEATVKKLSEADQEKFATLLAGADSENVALQFKKALVAGRSLADLETFAAKIKGKDEDWLQNNLRAVGSTTGRGIQQQFHMSCGVTSLQAIKAEMDPIYALQLHEENGDITSLQDDPTKPFAAEQKTLLETPKDPNMEPVHPGMDQRVAEYAAGLKENEKVQLADVISKLGSTYEKNMLFTWLLPTVPFAEVVAAAERNRGTTAAGGRAVHRSDKDAVDKGTGRFCQDLLSQQAPKTGLKYNRTSITDADRSASVDEIGNYLASGQPVPLVVGNADGELLHCILAVAVNPGPPKTFYIHDPGSGQTIAQTENQLKTNSMIGWPRLTGFEKPSHV